MKKTILVVEDDEFFREALVHLLQKNRYDTLSANNGRIAKDILMTQSVDLILSDIQMPYLTGPELLEWLNERSLIPCVLMTGFSNLLETLSAHELGAKGFLNKPFSNQELLDCIQGILGSNEPEAPAEMTQVEDMKYCSVSINEFVAKPQIEFDVFIRLSSKKFVKIGHAGSTLPVDKITEYRSKGVRHLYIRSEDFNKLLDFNFEVLEALSKHPKVSPEKRLNFVRYTGELILEKCFVNGIDKESFHEANNLVQQSVNSIVETKQNFDLINALNSHSNSVYAHSLGVALYSIMIARKMGLESTATFYKLSMGGLFHDIGKKEIPQEVLDKPRPLLQQRERMILETHPSRGKEILQELPGVPEDVVEITYQHHEDCLGTGFPRGLTKNKIHPLAKIVYVANRFVDLILSTDHKKGMPPEKAIKQLAADIDRMDIRAFEALKSFTLTASQKEEMVA